MIDLFNQDGQITISHVLGVDAEIPLVPALILFGPNDSGKTNTLLAITNLLRGRDPEAAPRDAFRQRRGRGECHVFLPLDLERTDHRHLLLIAAQHRREPAARWDSSSPGLFDATSRPAFMASTNPIYEGEGEGELDFLKDFEVVEVEGDDAEEDDAAGKSKSDVLVESLRIALLEHVGGLAETSAQSEALVDALIRCANLTLGWRASKLDCQDPSTFAPSGIDRAVLAQAYEAIDTPAAVFPGILPSIVDVVGSDDFERPMSDPFLAERVLKVTTGWERMRAEGLWDGDGWSRVLLSEEVEERRADPWFDEGTGLPADDVIEGCRLLSELATLLAPQFVTRDYRVEVQALEPRWWELNKGQRLRIALVPHDVEEPEYKGPPPGYGLDAVGSGLRVWTMFAVHEALRRSSKRESKTTLFVFDEPERHLHPAAQREVVSFIASIVGEGANVIVATHSPAFLNEAIPHARYVRLSRSEGETPVSRKTQAFPLDPGRLAAIERNLPELGLTRADLIQLTRGVLLVEGEHDRFIVQSFFGDDLADAHIRILSLRGTDNALALIDAELLQQLGVPVFLMLDRTSSQFVEDLNRGRITRGATKEERVLASLAVVLKSRQFEVTHVSLNVPDIAWALPEKAVKLVAPTFPGWKQVTAELRQHAGPINPKNLLRERYDLGITIRALNRLIAVAHEHELEPSPVLKSAIATVLSSVERAQKTVP